MRILLILLLLWPAISLAQLKVATGDPIEGESKVISGETETKLEVNQWIKPLDELQSTEQSQYVVKFKDGTLIKSFGAAQIKVLSETDVELIKGCVRAEFKDNFKLIKKDMIITPRKKAEALVCFADDSLIAISITGDIEFKKEKEQIGKVANEEFSVFRFSDSTLSKSETLNKVQFLEIQKKTVPENIKNIEKLVPYGLSGESVENRNEILFEEIKQLNSSLNLKIDTSKKEFQGGSRVNLLTGEIIHPGYNAYIDPFVGISYFAVKEKNEISVPKQTHTYFYQPPFEIEKITGGVRGIFDPQRFEVIKL